jgi:hypothetical protein
MFNIELFQKLLKTKKLGRSFIYRKTCTSTMDLSKREAEEDCLSGY